MPRRSILSATERTGLLALPESQDDLIRYYTFNETDVALIRQRRGDANRLGFAVQLCLLRYPGYALASDLAVAEPLIQWVARQSESRTTRGPNTASAMKRGANIFKNYAPISVYHRLACLTSAFWYVA